MSGARAKGQRDEDLGFKSVRANMMTELRWSRILEHAANGLTRKGACAKQRITKQTLDVYLQGTPGAAEQLRDAELLWVRRDWPLERIEMMCAYIALGKTVKEAAEEMMLSESERMQFYKIMLKDPEMRELYDEARQMQAETWADDIIDISDDGTNDTYVDDKGNQKVAHDVVNRAKLRVDSRKWIMARLHHERFGDRLKQEIDGTITTNHVEALQSARNRAEKVQDAATQAATSTPSPEDRVTH